MVVAGPSHLFRLDGGTLLPTDLVRGPWDHTKLHGGAVSAALVWTAQRALADDDDPAEVDRFQLCRLTVEILRPVPLAPLGQRATVVHRGRRSRVVGAELVVDGAVVARASTQWARRRSDTAAAAAVEPTDPAVPRRPVTATDPGAADIGYPRPGFNCDVFELRCLVGSTEAPGPGVIWTRLLVDVVEGGASHPVHGLAAVADLANAVGWDRSPNDDPMINPDLTLQLVRYPRGSWICLESQATATGAGIGIMESTLWDGDGRFGRVLSTTVESPVSLAVDL